MQRWALLHYLGQSSLPFSLSDVELRFFFGLNEEERTALQMRFRSRHRLAAALHLGYLRMTGRSLDAFKAIPRYLGEQLGVEAPTLASLRALYRRHRTLYEHQSWAVEYLGPEHRLFEWLAQAVPRRSTHALSEELVRLKHLQEMGGDRYALEMLNGGTLRHYAQAVRLRRPARMRQLRPSERVLQTVAYLKSALHGVTDRIARLTQRKGAELIRHASETVKNKESETIASLRARLTRIQTLVEDSSIDPATLRVRIQTEIGGADLRPSLSHAAWVREQLARNPSPVRALLQVMSALPLRPRKGHSADVCLDHLKTFSGSDKTSTPDPGEFPKVRQGLLGWDHLLRLAASILRGDMFRTECTCTPNCWARG
ncbi:MAG: DUF4158 domain-containing protein [Rhodocyclaceae bacterium]